MPPRPTLPARPSSRVWYWIESEGTDKAAEAMNMRVARELLGWDAGPGVDSSRNVITSATGAEYVNNYPMQRAPIPGGASLSRATTVTAAVANSNSYPNTMSLIAIAPPGVKGLLLVHVWNGNANQNEYAGGYQGYVASIYNETQTGIVAGNVLAIPHAALPEDNDFNYPASAARFFD